jgi:hypothetical protein
VLVPDPEATTNPSGAVTVTVHGRASLMRARKLTSPPSPPLAVAA